MLLDQIFLFLVAFFLLYNEAILNFLGFDVSVFAESDEIPWYLDASLSIGIIIVMLVSITMMVKRSIRLIF